MHSARHIWYRLWNICREIVVIENVLAFRNKAFGKNRAEKERRLHSKRYVSDLGIFFFGSRQAIRKCPISVCLHEFPVKQLPEIEYLVYCIVKFNSNQTNSFSATIDDICHVTVMHGACNTCRFE